MKKNLLILVCGLFLFTSCAKEESENVNQDSIYTIYELFYNQSTDKTTARATFRFGGPTGTLLDLNSPAVSTFNGDELLYNSVTGVHKKEYSGLTTSGTFVYTDLDNTTYTNSTPTMGTVSFPTIDTISSANSYTFTWMGAPVATGETMTLTIDGTQQSNFEVFSTSLVGATELILSQAKLGNLGLGNATLTLQRVYNKGTVTQGTTKGGRMAIWYTIAQTAYIQ